MEPKPTYEGGLKTKMLTTGKNPLILWREERGLSRQGLAVLAGISYNNLYALEAGYPRAIPRQTLEKLLDAGVPEGIVGLYLAWRSKYREKLLRERRDVH